MSAFSSGNCIICKDEVITSHIPCDKLCTNCSEISNKCKSCGDEQLP